MVCEIMSKNLMETEEPQLVRRMRLICWISKATRVQAHASACAPTPVSTRTHPLTHMRAHTQKYVIVIAFHGKGGFLNAFQGCVIRTLSVLLMTTLAVYRP
jgi:hypothetical protein